MDDQEHDSPVAVRDYPGRRVAKSRSYRLNTRLPVEVDGRRGMLPANFHTLGFREQFVERRRLFDWFLKHSKGLHRPDLNAMKRMENASFRYRGLGSVPGVQVGDSFTYRAEVYVVGLHRAPEKGIASVKQGDKMVACSVVVSGGYEDDVDRGNVIEYTGEGGKLSRGDGYQKEDQKLTGGNRALCNSYNDRILVRVIRGHASGRTVQQTRHPNVDRKIMKKYSYDGLYAVADFKFVEGSKGYKVYKFTLIRQPGQPDLDMTRHVSFSPESGKRR